MEGTPVFCYSKLFVLHENDKLEEILIENVSFDNCDGKKRKYIEPMSLQLIEDDREE